MRVWAKLGYFALGLMAAAGVVAALGVIRLTHQFPAAASNPGLLAPFLVPVLGLSLEAGALVALSSAVLGVLARVPPGDALSRARATGALLGLLAFSVAAAQLIPRGTEHPGAFANDLVQSARSSCGTSGKVPVPLLGFNVSCAPPQRIEGPMPGARTVQLGMGQLTFSDDLRTVEIKALELSAASSLRVRLRADTARVSGLAPWSRSARLSPLARFAVLAALGVVLWLGACLLLRPGQGAAGATGATGATGPGARVWRLLGYLLFASPGAVAAAAVISLDQAQAAPGAYAGAGALGGAALGLVALLLARFPRIYGYFRGN
jgi:hypothetical protein